MRILIKVILTLICLNNAVSAQWQALPVLNHSNPNQIFSTLDHFCFSFSEKHHVMVDRKTQKISSVFKPYPEDRRSGTSTPYPADDHFLFRMNDSLIFVHPVDGIIGKIRLKGHYSCWSYHLEYGWLFFDGEGNLLATKDLGKTIDTLLESADLGYPSKLRPTRIDIDSDGNVFLQYAILTGYILYEFKKDHSFREIYSYSIYFNQPKLRKNGDVIFVFHEFPYAELVVLKNGEKRHTSHPFFHESGEMFYAQGYLSYNDSSIIVVNKYLLYHCNNNGRDCKQIPMDEGFYYLLSFRENAYVNSAYTIRSSCISDSFLLSYIDSYDLVPQKFKFPNSPHGSKMNVSKVEGFELAWYQDGELNLYDGQYEQIPLPECFDALKFQFGNNFFTTDDEHLYSSSNGRDFTKVPTPINWGRARISQLVQDQWIIIRVSGSGYFYTEDGFQWEKKEIDQSIINIRQSYTSFKKGHWIQRFGLPDRNIIWSITYDHGETYTPIDLPTNTRFLKGDSLTLAYWCENQTTYVAHIDSNGLLSNTKELPNIKPEEWEISAMDDINLILWNSDSLLLYNLQNEEHQVFMDSLPNNILISDVQKSLTNQIYLNSDHGIYTYQNVMDSIDISDPHRLIVAPNPGQGKTRIFIPDEYVQSDVTIQIFRIQGGLEKGYHSHGQRFIEIDELPAGIFVATLIHEGVIRSRGTIVRY